MRLANQSDQLQTALGGGFVHEQHREQTQQNLPPTESRAIRIATVWLVFYVLAIVNIGVATFRKVAVRFLAAALLCGVATSATLGETQNVNGSHSTSVVPEFSQTVLTMAPDGSWGVATEIDTSRAIAVAIANCKKMYRQDIGCGSQFTIIRAGWSLAIRCGDENIMVAAKNLDDAIKAAANRENTLRQVYAREMPACVRMLTVNPHGVIIQHYLEPSQSAPATEAARVSIQSKNGP